MIDSISEEIEQGWRLLNKGKEEEALQIVFEIEKKENLTQEEILRSQILKCYLLFLLGNFEEALQISNHTIQESIDLKLPLLTIEATFPKWGSLFILGRNLDSWEDIQYCERLMKSPLHGINSEIEEAESLFFYMRGYFYYWNGDYELAKQYREKCYEKIKNSKRYTHLRAHALMAFGHVYGDTGELDKALEYHKKSLESTIGKKTADKISNAASLNSMGTIFYQKGDLVQAITHFQKSLEILESLNITFYIGAVYDNLVKATLDLNNFKQAKEILNQFSQFLKKMGNNNINHIYNLSHARILKSSTRTRDWTEAETILKEIIKKNVEFTPGLITLCDFYFQELKITNDLEILNDIQPLVDRLIKHAEQRNSFILRAHTLLLNGKIALLRLNMGDARRNLTQAQEIADSHGLQLLAREISQQHDILLEQLEGFENYKKKQITVSDRINLASMGETIDLMQGRREIKVPMPYDEEPVLLLILTNGGVPIFSHSFEYRWNFDSELFGGFLSAFNSISDEIFSEGLDRVKFGQHTVLMEPLTNFSICYLYKGQTYLAKQKLKEFTELLQESASIEQIFKKFENASQILEIEDFPFLKPLITKIFVKSN